MSKLGIGLVVIGASLLILASFLYVYQEERHLISKIGETVISDIPYTVTPYRDYVLPLCMVALACFITGFAYMVYEHLRISEKKAV